MSKFFYHGTASKNNERGSSSYGGNKAVRLGTKKAPAVIIVQTEERKQEVESVLLENKWVGEITVDAEKEENTRDLDILQSKTATVKSEKKASRNDPCPCGSGKKYKKCCGQ
ncbi:MAG: SEC-C metal-binding domain-containing protein [Kangiellaceae bacterium]|nr:SEC-C metal-binding domain-containing protein [Kangiellaceae bacterium]MCW9016051.1 SEC-C metal-binding domain-containing protein [Kangiellaceae bacterium]